MILLVSVKSSLDRIYTLPRLDRGSVVRASSCHEAAGGKAINVARTLACLDMEKFHLLGILGGFTGHWIQEWLERNEIHGEFIEDSNPSPLDVILIEEEPHRVTAIYQEQPEPDPASVQRLERSYLHHLPEARLCVLAGSSASAAMTSFLVRAIEAARKASVPVLLDTSGGGLIEGIRAGPMLIKPNRQEAEQVLARSISGRGEKIEAVRDLQSMGAEIVFLTDGGEDAVIAAGDSIWVARPPEIHRESSVGGGDALVAGFAYAYAAGQTFEACIRFAIACGTVFLQVDRRARISTERVVREAEEIMIERIDDLRSGKQAFLGGRPS